MRSDEVVRSIPGAVQQGQHVDEQHVDERPARRLPVLGLYAVCAFAATVVAAVAPALWHRGDAPRRPTMVLDRVLGNWLWWDGEWYLHIARWGYFYTPHRQSSVAFFPAYPLAVHVLGDALPGGYGLAAIVLTVASGAMTFVLFHRWCLRHLSTRAAAWAVVALAVYPYGWFLYGAAYSDALFLCVTLLAFLMLENDRPILAGLAGMIATATRPTGVVVLVGLVAVMCQRRGVLSRIGDRARVATRLRPKDMGVALAALGIVSWCTWLWWQFGRPFAFIETEGAHGWDRGPGPATWLKFGFFDALVKHDLSWSVTLLLQAICCVLFALAIPAVWRRFGAGYGLYVIAAVAVPAVSTDDFMGAGRYLLAAFPVLALVGARLASTEARVRWGYVTVSATGLALGTSLFATGHFLA